MLSVADVHRCKTQPAGDPLRSTGRMEHPDRGARVLQGSTHEGVWRVHEDHSRIAEDRTQAMEVINSVTQRVPGAMAGFVRVGSLVVCPQRTARYRVLALAARVDPGEPAIHSPQQPQ